MAESDVTAGPFTVVQPPHTIIDFDPFEGRAGDEVTITGTGFGDYGFVRFGEKRASCPTWTDTRIVWEPDAEPEFGQGGILLSDGSRIKDIRVTSDAGLWPEDPPLEWSRTTSGFKFALAFTEPREEIGDDGPYINTTTVEIHGEIELNSFHTTTSVTAEYTFVGKTRDFYGNLVDYSKRKKILREKVSQRQGFPPHPSSTSLRFLSSIERTHSTPESHSSTTTTPRSWSS